ncbi:hypothetical protein [Kocuria aegyptia]|uniref:Uncharacterized protein n=1 Tax=Kocuria aegyptia TaxID=330943 RepID=A0ABN2K2M1_9MICC
MTVPDDRPEGAWWSGALVNALVVFVTVVVGLLYGWGVSVPLGVALFFLRLRWQLGPFWTREQRSQIRRRAQQHAGGWQGSRHSANTLGCHREASVRSLSHRL